MSSTSDSQRSGTKACLSVELIEYLFTAFAQRRFEKNSGICLTTPPHVSNKFDHKSRDLSDPSGGLTVEHTQYYSFISNDQDPALPGDASLPANSLGYPAVEHRICMIYNTDSEGAASRIADSKHLCPLPAQKY